MGKKHYLLQSQKWTKNKYAYKILSPSCGAICTTYLLGEYINNLSQESECKEDAERELAVYKNCWNYVNYNERASNPFKIKQYLTEEKYFEVLGNQTALTVGFQVCLIAEAGKEDLETNPLFVYMKEMAEDAGMNEAEAKGSLCSAIGNDYEYFMGVFGKVRGQEQSPGAYHYILLHKQQQGWEYINPHDNEWKAMKADFVFQKGFQLEEWEWKNFGLTIKSNNKN